MVFGEPLACLPNPKASSMLMPKSGLPLVSPTKTFGLMLTAGPAL